MVKKWLSRIRRGESGQALLLALVMLLLGSLLIAPSLSYSATSLKTGKIVEEKMKGIYAADAGIEDAFPQNANLRVKFLRKIYAGCTDVYALFSASVLT